MAFEKGCKHIFVEYIAEAIDIPTPYRLIYEDTFYAAYVGTHVDI